MTAPAGVSDLRWAEVAVDRDCAGADARSECHLQREPGIPRPRLRPSRPRSRNGSSSRRKPSSDDGTRMLRIPKGDSPRETSRVVRLSRRCLMYPALGSRCWARGFCEPLPDSTPYIADANRRLHHEATSASSVNSSVTTGIRASALVIALTVLTESSAPASPLEIVFRDTPLSVASSACESARRSRAVRRFEHFTLKRLLMESL